MTAAVATPNRSRKTQHAQQASRRAAIYVRISLDQTGEGLGVARQEEDAHAIIEQRGRTLAGLYRDNSNSASDAKKYRPGYAEMQRDYAEGLFDALVVWDLDRLTPQPRQLEDWIDAAQGRGLAPVTTNGEADLAGGCTPGSSVGTPRSFGWLHLSCSSQQPVGDLGSQQRVGILSGAARR